MNRPTRFVLALIVGVAVGTACGALFEYLVRGEVTRDGVRTAMLVALGITAFGNLTVWRFAWSSGASKDA